MGSGIRNKYHIGINSNGFMLRGTPENPAYIKSDAPSFIQNANISDPQFAQFTGAGWQNIGQTDWSGGFQRLKFKDDASFMDGQGVDTISEYGNVSLQHNFTSAARITGSHSYGAHFVHDTDLLYGTVKSGTAKIFKLISAGTLTPLSAYAGISAVNTMSRFGNDTLIGLTRTSGTLKTLIAYRNGAISAFRSTNPIVRSVKGVGIRAYVGEYIAATSGDRLSYATNLSAFTSAYNAGKNRKIKRIEDLNGSPYFFIEEDRKVELFRWDEFGERAYSIYTFDDLTSWGVTKYISLIVITGTSNGRSVAFAFNGARLWQIFNDQLSDTSYNFSNPFVYDNNLQTKGASWDGQFWFPGLYGKYATVQYTPFVNFANRAYGYAITGTHIRLGYYDTTKRQLSGTVEGSALGYDLASVDKLLNCANVNCKALATGQMMEVSYSTDDGSNYTSLGTLKFATEGALTNKKIYFPSGFVARTWNYKVTLVGTGTTTPTLQDISFEYRPVPYTKRRWNISVDAGNNVKLLNGQIEERDGKAIMSQLWLEKEQKRTVVFEDVDAISAKFVSAMTSANTSARINNARGFPPKGRIRVRKSGVIEEMLYTSADGGAIKGITRGQKGTKARAYTSADSFYNNYTVLVTDIKERINNTDQIKTESVATITLLEV